ncbi:MAG: DUF6265 family protein [Pseudomonadales bacterium]|nr:DUF6265 family protein [Pseudomonadales bacterium]
MNSAQLRGNSGIHGVWDTPSAGSMLGLFKAFSEDGPDFYELQIMEKDEEGLALKVKHFGADFEAWEDKADHVRFTFIGMEENAIHFEGISYYPLTADKLEAYLLLGSGENVREERITYQRR